jgi:hypothetical protein
MNSPPETIGTKFIERFLAFVRSKPADERYVGSNPETCALAQFGLRQASLSEVGAEVFFAAVFDGCSNDMPADFYTFGALADRLASLLPTPPGGEQ